MRVLFYWVGTDPMPEWRARHIEVFRSFHPEFTIDIVHDKRYVTRPTDIADAVRFRYCGEQAYSLWIDSDIELLARLPLDDLPALAYETFPHHSICWSGAIPEMFAGGRSVTKTLDGFRQRPERVKMIPPKGLYRHWATGLNWERIPRSVWGYKESDFVTKPLD